MSFRLNIIENYLFKIGDTLEIAAQCAIEKGDIPAFERALAQLKPFYFDVEYEYLIFFYLNYSAFVLLRNRIPESPYRYLLLGLNLLCLLSQNRLADFHTVKN